MLKIGITTRIIMQMSQRWRLETTPGTFLEISIIRKSTHRRKHLGGFPVRCVNGHDRYSLHKGSPYPPPVQGIVCQALSCRKVADLASLSHFPDTWLFQAETIQGSFFKGKLLTKGFKGAFSLNDIRSWI